MLVCWCCEESSVLEKGCVKGGGYRITYYTQNTHKIQHDRGPSVAVSVSSIRLAFSLSLSLSLSRYYHLCSRQAGRRAGGQAGRGRQADGKTDEKIDGKIDRKTDEYRQAGR